MTDPTLDEARAQLAVLEAEYATAAAEANRLHAEANALKQAGDEAAARAAGVARRARPLQDIIRREEGRPKPDCPELAPIFAGYDAHAHVVHTVAGVIQHGRRRGCIEVERWVWGPGWRRLPVFVHPTGVPYGRRKPRIDPDVLAAAVAKCAAAREGQP